MSRSRDHFALPSAPADETLTPLGPPRKSLASHDQRLAPNLQTVSGWLGIAFLILLLVVAVGVHRVGQRTIEGDLNQIEEHPSWFLGVADHVDMLRWTIVVSAVLLTAATLSVAVLRSKFGLGPVRRLMPPVNVAQRAFEPPSRPARLVGCTVALVAAGLVLLTRRFVIDGQTVWALGDDAMISMRFAYQLANGNGLVWNPGEYIEGFTNPGWTLVMAAVHAVFPGRITPPLVMLLLSAILLGVTAWATAKLLSEILSVPARLAAVGAALICLSPPLLFWSVQGFEVAPMSATLAVAVLHGARDVRDRRLRPLTIALFALVTVWRADAVVAAALFGGSVAVFSGANRRSAVTSLAWMAAGVAAAEALQIALRLAYYGELVPNTAVLKTTLFPHQVEVGLAYVLLVLLAYLPLVVGLILLLRRPLSRIEATLLLPVAGMLLIVASEGGDVFPFGRPLAFCFPFVFAVVWARLAHNPKVRIHPMGTVVAVSAFVLLTPSATEMVQYLAGDPAGEERNLSIGLHMDDALPPGSKIGLFLAGSPAYFNELPAIDLLGKMDPVIARTQAKDLVPGHNKWDFRYSLLTRRPDYIMPIDGGRPTEDDLGRYERGGYPFQADLWRNETFLSQCAPNPVAGFDGLYHCNWSS